MKKQFYTVEHQIGRWGEWFYESLPGKSPVALSLDAQLYSTENRARQIAEEHSAPYGASNPVASRVRDLAGNVLAVYRLGHEVRTITAIDPE